MEATPLASLCSVLPKMEPGASSDTSRAGGATRWRGRLDGIRQNHECVRIVSAAAGSGVVRDGPTSLAGPAGCRDERRALPSAGRRLPGVSEDVC